MERRHFNIKPSESVSLTVSVFLQALGLYLPMWRYMCILFYIDIHIYVYKYPCICTDMHIMLAEGFYSHFCGTRVCPDWGFCATSDSELCPKAWISLWSSKSHLFSTWTPRLSVLLSLFGKLYLLWAFISIKAFLQGPESWDLIRDIFGGEKSDWEIPRWSDSSVGLWAVLQSKETHIYCGLNFSSCIQALWP